MNQKSVLTTCRAGSKTGFTLIEVIIVVSLVMLLSAIAVPSYVQWSRNAEYRVSARNIFYLLRETRSKAITSNLEHRVEFEPVNRRYRVIRGNRSSNSANWNTVICDWIVLPPKVQLDINVDVIHMNTNGTANGGTIKIQDNANTTKYEVRIARTGRIRIPVVL